MFQHTAARRRLQQDQYCRTCFTCFNTQPPEGGCAFSETFIHQGLLSPDSLKLSENAKSEYNTAFSATLAFLIS